MPIIKHTMLFAYNSISNAFSTVERTAGWSESVYGDNLFPVSFAALCTARALLLPASCTIIGQRFQQVNPTVGASSSAGQQFPGNGAQIADVPSMSLLCRIRGAGVANVRSYYIRGIPDAQVEGGEYKPIPPFQSRVEAFLALLKSQSWRFRGRNLAAAQSPIISVQAGFPVTGQATLTLGASLAGAAAGGFVRVLKTVRPDGKKVGGRYQIVEYSDVAGVTTLVVRNWNHPNTTLGKVRLDEVIFPIFDDGNVSRAVQRKVGRGFFQYRGKASKRPV